MTASDPSSPDPESQPRAAQRFTAACMPIDPPVENPDEAVRRLRTCSSTELRRARRDHRRALEALRAGGYDCLSDATRRRLADRLRRNLEALNRALDAPNPSQEGSPTTSSPHGPGGDDMSFSSRFRAFFQALW